VLLVDVDVDTAPKCSPSPSALQPLNGHIRRNYRYNSVLDAMRDHYCLEYECHYSWFIQQSHLDSFQGKFKTYLGHLFTVFYIQNYPFVASDIGRGGPNHRNPHKDASNRCSSSITPKEPMRTPGKGAMRRHKALLETSLPACTLYWQSCTIMVYISVLPSAKGIFVSFKMLKPAFDTVMDNATSQIATRRNQRDSSKCRRLALGT